MKVTLSERKKNLKGTNSGMDEAENQINDLEHKEEKTPNQNNKNRESKRNEDSISSFWDKFKKSNIHIIGRGGEAEGKEKEQETGNLFEKIMKENFLNLVNKIDMQVQEVQRVPNKMDAKRPTPRHIIIKMAKVKDKERLLKAAKEKQLVTYREVPIKLSADFSKDILQAR